MDKKKRGKKQKNRAASVNIIIMTLANTHLTSVELRRTTNQRFLKPLRPEVTYKRAMCVGGKGGVGSDGVSFALITQAVLTTDQANDTSAISFRR